MVKRNKYISKNGHLNDEYISLYIDAILLDKVSALPDEITEHAEECTLCKQSILSGYEFLKDDKTIDLEAHPYFGQKSNSALKKTDYSVFYRIAASFVFIVSAGLIAYYTVINKPGEKNTLTENIDTVSIKKDSLKNDELVKEKELLIKEPNEIKVEDLTAENILEGEEFQVSPVILSMLGNINRSGYLEVIRPKDSVIFAASEKIKFTWETDIEKELTLKIYNNKDILIFESKTVESKELLFENKLMHGSYYWKIESTDELFHLGLFFIKK